MGTVTRHGLRQSGVDWRRQALETNYKSPQVTHQQTSRRRTGTHTPHNQPYTDTPQLSHSIVKILCSRMKKDQRLQHECPVGMRFMYWQCEKQGQEGLRGRETCVTWRTRDEVREVLWQLQKNGRANRHEEHQIVCSWRRDKRQKAAK